MRLELYAVNCAAEQAGLTPGMALSNARAILPSLTVLPARPHDDSKALSRLADWCGRYSPWTAAHDMRGEITETEQHVSLEGPGGGGLWIDASGCAHLFGGEDAMLGDITCHIARAGYAVRAAIADTLGCSWAVARFAEKILPWTVVSPGNTKSTLAPLPISALRLPVTTVTELNSLGIRKISDLMALPSAPLTRRFGKEVLAQLDAALGNTAEPISPSLPETSHIARLTFAEPIGWIEDIKTALDRLLQKLCQELEHAQRGARRLVFILHQPDGTTARIAIGTSRPNRTPTHLARLFAEHLHTIEIGFGVEDIVLAATITEPLDALQTEVFQTPQNGTANPKTLDDLIDRLSNRLGSSNVLRPILRKSYLPERTAGLTPITQKKKKETTWEPIRGPSNPRPLRLLCPPEPIKMITDNNGNKPPTLFRWRRVLYHITRIEGPERIASEWWREQSDENSASHTGTRDYYRIEDTNGYRFWIYHNMAQIVPNSWYLHGLFG